MPFNAFVVYETAPPYLIRGFGFNQAQADARAAEDAGWSAHQGVVANIPDSAVSGDFFFNPASVVVSRVAITAAGMIVERRNVLLTLLRELEKIDGSGRVDCRRVERRFVHRATRQVLLPLARNDDAGNID